MPTFKNIKSMMNYVQSNVKEILSSNEIQNIIKETIRDVIMDEVYDKYDPTQYVRRYDEGGFSDKRNYICKINISNNYVSVTIFNDTTANGDNGNDYLDEIIYRGDMYTWENSKIYQMMPYPRNWINESVNRLYDSGELMKRLSKRLSERGIKIIY